MNFEPKVQAPSTVYNRLVALWVICEAFAGGIMHGLKIPFTGMIVSGLAVICIVLIAKFPGPPGAIIKATVIVAIFKLMLSPHSPPTAYIAVFFQGLLGQLLFSQKKYFTAAAIVLGILALVESALQRLLVLVILYGNVFWEAVDKYIQKLLGENKGDYSLWLAEGYIAIHFVGGLLIGWHAARLANRAEGRKDEGSGLFISLPTTYEAIQPKKKKRKKRRVFLLIAWLLLSAMFLQSWLAPAQAVLPRQEVLYIFFRSLIIILSWYLFVSPIIMMLIKKSLARKKQGNEQKINTILQLLPQTYFIFSASWSKSASERGLKRISFFIKILLLNILYNDVDSNTTTT